MSFLEKLRAKRRHLKPATTTLTCLDGRRFEECASQTLPLERMQFGFVVDTEPDNVPAKITDFVYLGSQDCCEIEILIKFDIKYVLSVGVEAPNQHEDIFYKFVQCLDLPETNLDAVLKTSVSFIEEAVHNQKNILVHCNAGVSRSASVVIGYLILVCGFDYVEAFSHVKKCRTCIRPNDGFVEHLKKLTRG